MMDTNRIKKFATEARNILKRGIAAKIKTLGFDAKGNVPEDLKPQLMQGGSLWNGQLETERFYYQWISLYHKIQTKGINEVYEEAAYTWFNRLMAIRILQKNGLCEPVMEYADAARTPRIVNEARMGNMPQMPEEVRSRLVDLLDDDTKVTEQFAVLVTAWCHQNPIIQNCFGGIKDYTELLLPNNILSEGGFVDMINHTEFITDDDYKSAELIGWLYQFYISERKDEVFSKKGKFEADEIPAATQIFTPNWIVKYMVENTIGRIYLDNNPDADEEFSSRWKYLINSNNSTPEEAIYHYSDLTDLKVADLACGSGHILNECFDLLYDLYIYEAYSRSEAVENIFKYNITGLDLDNRAKQMAQFALLIKACQKDNRFADAHIMPNVLTIPEEREVESQSTFSEIIDKVCLGTETPIMIEELQSCYALLQDGESLGAIMKFQISESTRLMLKQTLEYWEQQTIIPSFVKSEILRIKLILALTEKYSSLIMNPPYMGNANMNDVLTSYVKSQYKEGKTDLFAVFMILAMEKLEAKGKFAMINMQSWMFLSSFESIRTSIITHMWIENMLHLGPRTFDELAGEVVQNTAFVISNVSFKDRKGIYFRLVEKKSCHEKEQQFLLDNSVSRQNLLSISQDDFKKIPGSLIGYWISDSLISSFQKGRTLKKDGDTRQGMATSDNGRFLRLWFEVDFLNFGRDCIDAQMAQSLRKKWYPYNKGGQYRKWYGNQDYVINYYNDGEEVKAKASSLYGSYSRTIKSISEYFKPCLSWSKVSSGHIAFRYFNPGFVFDVAGCCIFFKDRKLMLYNLALLNSKPCLQIFNILSPTLNYEAGHVASIPVIYRISDDIEQLVDSNIKISKLDWDSHETSWNFKLPEILSIDTEDYTNNINWLMEDHYKKTGEHLLLDSSAPQFDDIEWCYEQYCLKWKRLFYQLKENEEELNRQFIEIYALQNELTPTVTLKEITILQQGEIAITNDNQIKFNGSILMKQLISYAVGIWMGRYRLDKPGLYIASSATNADDLESYLFHGVKVNIDDDAIIPILPFGCPFDDNLASRVVDFIRIVFGEERLTENLNFMEKQLGTTIEQYLLKDFWKDHKKMYQNRPIYWLFSSKKGAFKCLAYMHRMTPYTAERVRAKYLLPYIEKLNQQINDLTNRAASLSTAERRQLENLRKIHEECNEYHDRLQVLAEDTERTTFNLDDGVLVNYAKYGDILAKLK